MTVAGELEFEELSEDVMRQAEAAGLGSAQFERAVRLGVRVEVVRYAVLWITESASAPTWNMTLTETEAAWLREVGFDEDDPADSDAQAAVDLASLLDD